MYIASLEENGRAYRDKLVAPESNLGQRKGPLPHIPIGDGGNSKSHIAP